MSVKKKSFTEWCDEAGKEIEDKVEKDTKKSGNLVANNYFERIHYLYVSYKASETARSLVRGTWVLAVATIILAISTIILTIINLALK